MPTALKIPLYSPLPLDLIGIVFNKVAPENSVCLIRTHYPSNKDDVFQSGQNVFDIAEIKEIRPNGVFIYNLLTNNPEYLTFPKYKPFVIHPSPSPPAPRVVTKSSDTVAINIPKDTVAHYLKNLPALLDSAFAVPRYLEDKNGGKNIGGFEINRIKAGSIVERLDLKNGDVILDVNGKQLDSLATVMQLIGQIQTTSEVKMTVLRGKQKLNFVFNRK